MTTSMSDEIRYQLLRYIQENPNVSQRELASKMGVSVGKVNYCIKALVDVGHIKLNNFKSSQDKAKYAYLLTPKGIKEKMAVTVRFLESRRRQYDLIEKEIQNLQQEVAMQIEQSNKNNHTEF